MILAARLILLVGYSNYYLIKGQGWGPVWRPVRRDGLFLEVTDGVRGNFLPGAGSQKPHPGAGGQA